MQVDPASFRRVADGIVHQILQHRLDGMGRNPDHDILPAGDAQVYFPGFRLERQRSQGRAQFMRGGIQQNLPLDRIEEEAPSLLRRTARIRASSSPVSKGLTR